MESLSNLVAWHQSAFKVIPQDRASCVARVGFDAAVWEIWPYLTAGASLHVPDGEETQGPESVSVVAHRARHHNQFRPDSDG